MPFKKTAKASIYSFSLIVAISFASIQVVNAQENLKNAKQKRPSAKKLFAEMDIDNDGKLSKNEVKGKLADHFSKIDANEDGFLSKEELKNAKQQRRRRKQGN